MRLSVPHILGSALLAAAWVALSASPAGAEPPQFGIEVEAGTGLGMTSYIRNEVRTEVDRTRTDEEGQFLLTPYLADRETGQATAVAARFVASNIVAGLSFRWFDLPAAELHHVGRQHIDQDRQRPDGSFDDSGVDYQQLEPALEQPIPEEQRDTLMVFGLEGGYRFVWPTETLDIFVPVGGALVVTNLTAAASPYRLGLQASSGVGMSVEFASSMSLLLTGRMHALATTHYGRREDSARRAVSVDEPTEDAFFSTLVYGTANVGLQFRIR